MEPYASLYPRDAEEMVAEQIAARGIVNPAVIAAMKRVPRHLFVPERHRLLAYTDQPLPIGYGQTISQPYVVAFMTEALGLDPEAKVLEIGTGSGYQAAILAEIAREVYTIEVIAALADRAATVCRQLGYGNIHFRTGNGREGWPEQAPFTHIIVTAASTDLPQKLLDQLAVGGKMIIPIGSLSWGQDLVLICKENHGYRQQKILPVRFVPLVKPATERNTRREKGKRFRPLSS